MEKKGKKIGIEGESHIWDGPLSQLNRSHGPGRSNGLWGMKLPKAMTPYTAGPITEIAKGKY
jgi:hypothetical protein